MKRPVHSRRGGFSVGTVILLAVLCLFLAFVVAGLCTFQLNAASKSQNSEQALHLAEGAISQAVHAVHSGALAGTPYGLHNEDVLFAPYAEAPDRCGEVTFNTSSSWGYSANNCDGKHAIGFNGTNEVDVSQSAAYLVGRGVAGSSTRLVEVMVSLPQYQYVLSVDGALTSAGPLMVKAEPSMAALFADPTLTNPLGANVGSNTSIQAEGGSFVSGDVVCTGSVTLDNPSTVLGVVRTGQVSQPYIPIANYNNQGPTTPVLPSTVNSSITLQSNTYAPGPVTVNGDLTLSGASLYVASGTLTINGALNGTGAVFVNGNVLVNGGADLDATSMVALLATGNVTLNGASSLPKYFQGLVYTNGVFSTSNITIAGAFVSANPPDSSTTTSSVNLGPNTTVVYVPAAATIAATTNLVANMSPGFRDYLNGPVSGSSWTTGGGGSWCPMFVATDNPADSLIYNAVQAVPLFTSPAGQDANYAQGVGPSPGQGQVPQAAGETTIPAISVGCFQAGTTNWVGLDYRSIQYDPTTNQFVALNPPQVGFSCNGVSVTQGQFDTDLQLYASWLGIGSSNDIIAYFNQAQAAYMQAANQLLQNPTLTTSTTTVPALSLSSFLSDSDPIRMVLWRAH